MFISLNRSLNLFSGFSNLDQLVQVLNEVLFSSNDFLFDRLHVQETACLDLSHGVEHLLSLTVNLLQAFLVVIQGLELFHNLVLLSVGNASGALPLFNLL